MYILKEKDGFCTVINDGKALLAIISADKTAEDIKRYTDIVYSLGFGESFSFENFTIECVKEDEVIKAISKKTIKSIVSSTIAYEDVQNIALSFEVPDSDFDLIEACKKAAVAYCKTEEGYEIFTEDNCHCFNWADFDLYVPNSIMEQFGFRKIEGVNADYTVDFDEQLVLDKDVSPSENEVERIFEIELVNYDEENIPQHCSTIYVKSNLSLDTAKLHILKTIPEISEAMEEEGAEGILSVSVISDDEFEEIKGDIELIYL